MFPFIVTVQVPVPPHPPPLQAENVEPLSAPAERVTELFRSNVVEQELPQVIPDGLLVTVPSPDPALVTVRVKAGLKVAVTVMFAVMVTVHVPVPEQPPPLHPAKLEPAAGEAVRVTEVAV